MRVLRGRAVDPESDRATTQRLAAWAGDTGEPAVRVWRPHPTVAFGRRDATRDGYDRALRTAREHGYEVVERSVGGHAVTFTGSTVAFLRAEPVEEARTGIGTRYDRATEDVAAALATVGAPVEQALHLALEFLLRVGEPGEVALLEDRGAEARLGEDHHAGGGLQEVRAGARADHKEEGVLHLAVEPDDPGQPAEHLALAAFLEDGRVAAARGGRRGEALGHAASCWAAAASAASAARRAMRSFQRNWPALTT